MSIRRADLRFALPRPARRAVVFGGLAGWRKGLEVAGIGVAEPGETAADLAVAPAELAAEAMATRADAVILEGRRGASTLAAAGYAVRRYLPLPSLDAPDLVLSLQPGPATRYALERWRPADTPGKRLRNRAAAYLIARDALPELRPVQAVGIRTAGPPFPIAAAAAFGVPPDADWFMTVGQGDPLTRVAFHLLPLGADEPVWVLKLARVRGYRESFDRDEIGLGLAHGARSAAAHAPSLIGRFEADGLHASLETAAVGEPLSALLLRDRRAALAVLEEIAAWILRVGQETAAASDTLADERQRLTDDVLAHWLDRGAPSDLVERLPKLQAVLQHNDLGSWNIVVQPSGGFAALDWESARRHGLPLWDLLYFLVDVLPQLDGARTAEERVAQAVRVLRGDVPSSEILFRWLRRAVGEAHVPPDAVGAVATLGWLHHAHSRVARSRAVALSEAGTLAPPSPIDRLAPLWLSDPALGCQWSAWRG